MEMTDRLAALDLATHLEGLSASNDMAAQWVETGVGFACSDPAFETQYWKAVGELFQCIRSFGDAAPILQEGGIYLGCWLESTGTINAELLSRFLPQVARETFLGFAAHQRDDGLFPYKLTADGPVFAQIQTVTPLARSVWTHAQLNGGDRDFLARMYAAMARNDAWLATHRDTRGTGGVEAFCTYDTGHDLSSRFWHIPDSPLDNAPERYDPAVPGLPYVAPDLTANVACQRRYLAKIAALLDQTSDWAEKAEASETALYAQCYDAGDEFFYDRNSAGDFVRVQSDVLLRVLACEIGDDVFFDGSLARYLLNSSKFFARYPFPSIALDDPRYDPVYGINSWNGPTNFLSIIRAAHAFEHHGRHVEFTWVLQPILSALFRMERFAQTISPHSGGAGFTEVYSPTILCLLDFVERLSGIQPRPDGTLWHGGLTPRQISYRDRQVETAYRRIVEGRLFTLENGHGVSVGRVDGREIFKVPAGLRLVTDRTGEVLAVTNLVAHHHSGVAEIGGHQVPFDLAPNATLSLIEPGAVVEKTPALIMPAY